MTAAFPSLARGRTGLCLVLLSLLPLPHALAASASPTFTYRRIFKSSTPEFIEIKIDENSENASYEIRQLDEDPGATPFEISPALRAKIFQLIAQLHGFKGADLDIHRKIANLGEKTFRYESGSEAHELLQRRIKYDRLGVNDALLELETDFTKGVLPEPQRLLPLLDQIAGDYRFVDIARQRARALAEKVRHSG